MTFDLFADLAGRAQCPATAELPTRLASGFVDDCTAWFAHGALETNQRAGNRKKNDARNCYMKRTADGDLFPPEIADLLDPPLDDLQPGWLAIDVDFTLQTPWYSKDDRPLHVLDNPVRKGRVFGVPFMAASSWKGLLRWSCRMEHGLLDHLAGHGGEIDGWHEPSWVVRLFGNVRGEDEDFSRGALHCFPTWFDKIGFEVINPHDRARRAGTQPIYYEVVPGGSRATLHLLYAPAPGQALSQRVDAVDALSKLLEAAKKLLTVYGFSAKRSAGWGLAEVFNAEIRSKDESESGGVDDIKAALPRLLSAEGGPA